MKVEHAAAVCSANRLANAMLPAAFQAEGGLKLWFSGGSERLGNCPVDSFQRRTGRQAPELGAEPTNKLLQNIVSLHCLLLLSRK